MANPKVALPGSNRQPLGAPAGAVPPNEIVDVSVILKPKVPLQPPAPGAPPLDREQFAARYAPDPAVIQQLQDFARQNGLTVLDVSPDRRTVRLQGTAGNMSKAFDVPFERYTWQGCLYRARTGSVHVPAQLAGAIEAVLGLDDRPHARPHFRIYQPDPPESATVAAATPNAISYTPPQVAKLYQFPSGADGAGQAIAILELGGGYKPGDITSYFSSLGIQPPTVTAVFVDGGTNAPTTPSSADGEVLLDIEVSGSVAPAAHIVVYFAPNTTAGFQDALSTAIHDTANHPSVISISWGSAESTWTAQAMSAFDTSAQAAALLGVTICAAAGDSGSSDGVTPGNHVDFPASSPNILACGGTSLRSASGSIASETVWNDGAQGGATGGGFSAQFPQPAWQKVSGSGRGVPDVSGNADPETGYQVLVDGQSMVIGGTSAVAPLWAGLIALLNQKLGKPVGFLQPAIYTIPASAQAFHDITQGNNGAFSAGPGWDPCTGLGSPEGQKLLQALTPPATGKHT